MASTQAMHADVRAAAGHLLGEMPKEREKREENGKEICLVKKVDWESELARCAWHTFIKKVASEASESFLSCFWDRFV
jgi:hypothetical protein